MICDRCATAADIDADPATPRPDGEVSTGHSPTVCRDFGKEIRACGCQHGPQRRTPPGAPHGPQGAQK